MADRDLFAEVADALHGMMADDPTLHCTHHRYGIKVWLGGDAAPKEHYEAQVVGRQHVPEAKVLALEIGFHSEHPKERDNEDVMVALLESERSWRRVLGADPVAGEFLGSDRWRRLSEVWPDPNLSDPELVFEIAERLTEYLDALEPRRRRQP